MRFALLALVAGEHFRDVQHPRLHVAAPAQPALDIEHAAQIAEHDGIGAAGGNMLALVIGKPRRYFAKLAGERAAESAASLALGHLDEFQARYAREQGPRRAFDSHLAVARAVIGFGDGGS